MYMLLLYSNPSILGTISIIIDTAISGIWTPPYNAQRPYVLSFSDKSQYWMIIVTELSMILLRDNAGNLLRTGRMTRHIIRATGGTRAHAQLSISPLSSLQSILATLDNYAYTVMVRQRLAVHHTHIQWQQRTAAQLRAWQRRTAVSQWVPVIIISGRCMSTPDHWSVPLSGSPWTFINGSTNVSFSIHQWIHPTDCSGLIIVQTPSRPPHNTSYSHPIMPDCPCFCLPILTWLFPFLSIQLCFVDAIYFFLVVNMEVPHITIL